MSSKPEVTSVILGELSDLSLWLLVTLKSSTGYGGADDELPDT